MILPFDAVSRCEDVRRANESSSADVDVVVLVFLQDSRLPAIQ